eukprot:scaffold294478_cov35-Tisochrysis_lutea.AAC.2
MDHLSRRHACGLTSWLAVEAFWRLGGANIGERISFPPFVPRQHRLLLWASDQRRAWYAFYS